MAVEAFEIETAFGSVTLPSLATVPAALLKKVIALPEGEERVWFFIEELSSVETLNVLDQLSTVEMNAALENWGKASGIAAGELIRIAFILDRHTEALESDLIGAGLRLRHCPSEDFDWRDLMVFIRHLPVTSSLFGALFPDQAGWTREAMLLADQVDWLATLAWQKTKDGRKGRNPPARVPRPGVTPPKRSGSNPEPSRLSVLKERMAARYAQARRKPTKTERSQQLNDVFGRR